MKLNAYLIKSTIVAALGGLLFGFDTAVIAGTTHALTETYHLSHGSLGLTVAAALWGTIIGAMLAGIPGDRYGRRDSLRLMAVLYVISALGCVLAWDWYSLVLFRFIGGLGIGGSSVLGPMYVAEIAPAKYRGRLVGFFQFNVVFGILLAYFSNYVIGLAQFGATEWRWKLGVSGIPAVLFLLMLFGIPRSPRWLVKKGRVAEAREILRLTGEENLEDEMRDMVQSVSAEGGGGREIAHPLDTRQRTIALGLVGLLLGGFGGFLMRPAAPAGGRLPFETVITRGANLPVSNAGLIPAAQASFDAMLICALTGALLGLMIGRLLPQTSAGGTLLLNRDYRKPIFLAVSIAMFNQLSGINAVLYYLNDIFMQAGFSKVSGDLQAVAIGATNLIFTMLAMSVIDKIGRKTLLLIGSVGLTLSLAGVATIFAMHRHQGLLVWLLVGFIASFAFSQGAVIWVYLSEVFPNRVRAQGQSLGSFTHWIMNALISGMFPLVAAASGAAPFVFFAAMMALQFFVVLFTYPETKGVTLEQMQKKMGIA